MVVRSRGVVLVLALAAACGDDNPGAPDAGADAAVDAAPTPTYAIGGTVTNLVGTGLVLENNDGDPLPVTAAGTFTFPTELDTGDAFAVTVATQPTNPQQTCTVSGGTGTVGTSDVTSVTVDCVTDLFTIGGSVLGLVGTSVLTGTLSGGATEQVTIAADGTYAFPTAVPMGTTFAIAVDTQPATALCYVVGPTATPGMGTVGTADVADVDIRCVGTPTVAAVAGSCDTSTNPITWSEVPGASYTLSYGTTGNLTTVAIPAGTTTYTANLGPGDYVASVQAHVGTLDGPPSNEVAFHVGTTPVVTASNNGPACVGGNVTLTAQPAGAASYAWTGPNGAVGNTQTALLTAVGSGGDPTGTYTVTVTQDGCSASATTMVAASSVNGAFTQTTTADFNANTNASVSTANDQVQLLGDGLALGTGTTAFNPTSNVTLPGGLYDFSSFTIPAGVIVTVTGTNPLIIRTTGTVQIDGVLDAHGQNGGDGVTFTRAGTGGFGVAGGANGGDGTYSASIGEIQGAAGAGPGGGSGGRNWSGGGGAGHATQGGNANQNVSIGGSLYGSPSIPGIEAGSGGGGGSGGYGCGSGGGGGGGGYIRIDANAINVGTNGQINVSGGQGGSDGTGNCGGGGGGSGGAIHLRARTVGIAGGLNATGGSGGASTIAGTPYFGIGGAGASGRIRIEAGTSSVTGNIVPTPVADPLPNTTGSTRTIILAPMDQCRWGTLTYNVNQPAGSTLVVNVLDGENNILVGDVASGTNLQSAIPAGTPVRLQAVFGRTNATTPALLDWSITWVSR